MGRRVNRNPIGNLSNRHQGKFKRVLCVCTGGLLRSPTMAVVLANEPYNFNTRSAGVNREYALNLIDENLILWADEIVCADDEHMYEVNTFCAVNSINLRVLRKKVLVLGIPDVYDYRDPALVELIKEKYNSVK